jgi:arsenate reductase
MSIELYHNPRCSKSREAKTLLENENQTFSVKLYLNDQPSQKELVALVKKLNIPAEDLIRKKEKIFLAQDKRKNLTDNEAIKLMEEHPILIERPIVIKGDKAVIGRPIENIISLIK